jgi:hypothetical protein
VCGDLKNVPTPPVLAEMLTNIKTIVRGSVSSVTSHVLEDVGAEID